MSDQPKPTGEWTGLMLSRLIKKKGYKAAANVHNAALASARLKAHQPKPTAEGYSPNRCDKHGTPYFNVCPDCADLIHVGLSKPTNEWHFDGESRVLDADDNVICVGVEIQGPFIVDAHNAALAAEREQRQHAEAIASNAAIDGQILREQLAAEREKHEQELHDLTCYLEGNCYSDPDFIKDSTALKAAKELREQLAAAVDAWGRVKNELEAYDIGFLRRNTLIIGPLDAALGGK